MIGHIFDIKEMAVHDGPGIRTTLFLKGCPLRCKWCHNPEGLTMEPQIMFKEARCKQCGKCKIECEHNECKTFNACIYACPEQCYEVTGKKIEAKQVAYELIKTAEVLMDSFGGFTLSGGEPMMQKDFVLELCKYLKDYHLCIETSGYADSEIFKEIIDVMDYVIMDIKIANSDLHKKYTGVYNDLILNNFEILKNSGKPYLIRTPLIPSITDTEKNLSEIKEIIGDSPWEKIPYNQMAGAKYKMLGLEYPMDSLA